MSKLSNVDLVVRCPCGNTHAINLTDKQLYTKDGYVIEDLLIADGCVEGQDENGKTVWFCDTDCLHDAQEAEYQRYHLQSETLSAGERNPGLAGRYE